MIFMSGHYACTRDTLFVGLTNKKCRTEKYINNERCVSSHLKEHIGHLANPAYISWHGRHHFPYRGI